MIKEALQSDGVEESFQARQEGAKEVDLFDDEFLAKLEKIKMPNTKIKLLQQLLKRAIEDFKKDQQGKRQPTSRRCSRRWWKSTTSAEEQDVLVSNVLEDFT